MARKSNKKRGPRRRKSTNRRVGKRRVGKKRSVKRRGGKRRGNGASFSNAMRKLSSLRPPQRVQAMKLANDKFVRQFCQKVKGLQRARLSPSVQKQLRRKSKHLRKLVSPKTSVRTKRGMLTQRGGFLSALIPIIIKTALGI